MKLPSVLGESAEDVGAELLRMTFSFGTELCRVEGRVVPNGPLMRAMCRAEAELLLEDADAMAAGTYVPRTVAQRGADAFVLVAERLGEAARSG